MALAEYVPLPAAYVVPVPSAELFQPENEYPVRSRVPEFVDTVVAAPPETKLPLAGTEPEVAPFALYVMVYVGG